jgi:hypothetical protein
MGLLSEYRDVSRLLGKRQRIVFYAETRHHYQYFDKLITDLLAMGIPITYITSDRADPLLSNAPPGMKVIRVKWMLGFLFSRLNAEIMVMTMPDLDNFLFRRSRQTDCYVYIFHAAVSTHQQYRKKAFYHYDAIFCTGPYQELELQTAEILYGLKKKDMVAYGYPLLQKLRARLGDGKNLHQLPRILIAPSWFDGCIFDTCLPALLEQLSVLPYEVVLRSHPEYEKRKPREFRKIGKLISSNDRISLDRSVDVIDSLSRADILVTDRSGIAFEYAFGIRRPVLFIDTALKQNNPDWEELQLPPVENALRDHLGVSVSPSDLVLIAGKIQEIQDMTPGFSEKIEVLEKNIFFNQEKGSQAGVDYILNKLRIH